MLAPGFTGSSVDRMDEARHDEALLQTLRSDTRALSLDLSEAVHGSVWTGRLPWTALDPQTAGSGVALLGRLDGIPLFVPIGVGAPLAPRSFELMSALGALSSEDAGIYATARSVVDWHARNGYCANCGTVTLVVRAGWGRSCLHCGAQHFPRVDPVVIMLAQHGDGDTAKVLVGRQPQFPTGMYSALAGFVEPGESIEEAVSRELREEAGIAVSGVKYIASQPWPFPSQLMVACICFTEDDQLTIDHSELENAMWVNRGQVRAALSGQPDANFSAPMPIAIAHYLLNMWGSEETG